MFHDYFSPRATFSGRRSVTVQAGRAAGGRSPEGPLTAGSAGREKKYLRKVTPPRCRKANGYRGISQQGSPATRRSTWRSTCRSTCRWTEVGWPKLRTEGHQRARSGARSKSVTIITRQTIQQMAKPNSMVPQCLVGPGNVHNVL